MSEPNCDNDYLGETGRIIQSAADHFERDKRSHLLTHALISNQVVDLEDLKVTEKITMETSIRGRYQKLYTLSSTDHR